MDVQVTWDVFHLCNHDRERRDACRRYFGLTSFSERMALFLGSFFIESDDLLLHSYPAILNLMATSKKLGMVVAVVVMLCGNHGQSLIPVLKREFICASKVASDCAVALIFVGDHFLQRTCTKSVKTAPAGSLHDFYS